MFVYQLFVQKFVCISIVCIQFVCILIVVIVSDRIFSKTSIFMEESVEGGVKREAVGNRKEGCIFLF